MVSEEDRIKYPIYIRFQEAYFSKRTDKKSRFLQLNTKERKDFCHQQRLYVEKEYQLIRYGLNKK